jgi:hypothetical protein
MRNVGAWEPRHSLAKRRVAGRCGESLDWRATFRSAIIVTMLKSKTIITSIKPSGWKQIVLGVAIAGAVGLTFATKPLSYTAAIPAVRVWQGECFASDCQPNRQNPSPPGIRNWVSWKTQDGGTGKLVLGPFAAPASLSLAVVGYPNGPGNRLYVERLATGEVQEIEVTGSESWQETECLVPAAWRGHPVHLVAIDGATGGFGWLGITEPYDHTRTLLGVRQPRWVRALRAFAVSWLMFVGLFALVVQTSACVALEVKAKPLAGAAVVFLFGYAAFWLYFLHPMAGYLASACSSLIALYGLIRLITEGGQPFERDIVTPLVVAGLLGVFFTAFFTLSEAPMSIAELAQYRLTAGLPVDNSIPGLFADRLYVGQSPRLIIGDWLSSDRPPLQTGWILLSRPVADWLAIDRESSTYVAGIVAQLPWVIATWWMVRWVGLSCGVAALLCTAFAATGFFAQNTLFVWPKMLAAALSIGAGLLFLDDGQDSADRRLRWPWAATFAATATLAHGGAWFSNLGLAPFFLVSSPWRSPKTTLTACAIAAAILLPWMAYQKLYEPPGDRLLKWHLAGQMKPDTRTLSKAIVDAYQEISIAEVADNRWRNLVMQFKGDYRGLVDPRSAGMLERRADEFSHSFRAVGWWNLGWLLCPIAFVYSAWNRDLTSFLYRWRQLALWAFSTFVVWIGLMFMPNSATIHHGSYALQLMLFVIPAVMLAKLAPGVLVGVAGLSVAVFFATWVPMPPWLEGYGYSSPAIMIAIAAWVTAFAFSSPCRERESIARPEGGRS